MEHAPSLRQRRTRFGSLRHSVARAAAAARTAAPRSAAATSASSAIARISAPCRSTSRSMW
jgi:hypothetical protein